MDGHRRRIEDFARRVKGALLAPCMVLILFCPALEGCRLRSFNGERAEGSDIFANAMKRGSEKRLDVTVHSLIDTDALRIEPLDAKAARDPRPWRVRLIGIDAPEPDRGAGGQEPWAEHAAQALSQMTREGTGHRALLRSSGVDAFDRYLGRLEVDKVDVGLELVKLGLAWPFPDCFGNAKCRPEDFTRDGASEIERACEDAAASGKGVHAKDKGLKETAYEYRARVRNENLIAFVGDLESWTYVPVARMAMIPTCRRVFFTLPPDVKGSLAQTAPNHPANHGYKLSP